MWEVHRYCFSEGKWFLTSFLSIAEDWKLEGAEAKPRTIFRA